MSANKKRPQDLPKDAVILTYDQALGHQLDLIREWDNTSEAWPLRSGVSILGIAASSAGIFINNHYRRKLKLKGIGLLTTYLPIVVMPGIATTLLHKMIITYNLVMEDSQCPLCLQARAAVMQASSGFMYPLLLAPLGNYMYATRHGTVRLPDILSDPRGVLRQLYKFTRPIGVHLSLIFVGQLLLGSYFTYLEGKSYFTIKKHMREIEEEYDNNRKSFGDQRN